MNRILWRKFSNYNIFIITEFFTFFLFFPFCFYFTKNLLKQWSIYICIEVSNFYRSFAVATSSCRNRFNGIDKPPLWDACHSAKSHKSKQLVTIWYSPHCNIRYHIVWHLTHVCHLTSSVHRWDCRETLLLLSQVLTYHLNSCQSLCSTFNTRSLKIARNQISILEEIDFNFSRSLSEQQKMCNTW